MRVTSNQYSDAVSNMAKRKIYSDLSLQLTNEIAFYIAHCIRIMIILIDKETHILQDFQICPTQANTLID
jgi:hypothetical protein